MQIGETGVSTYEYYESSSMFHGSLKGIMGTRFNMLILEKSYMDALNAWCSVVLELRRLDCIFNRFNPESETALINREAIHENVYVNPEMWSILLDCREYNIRTLGLFDITLKDFSQVSLDEERTAVQFLQPGISLDFGGYAKGYALNKIKSLLLGWDVRHCFVNFGDSSILGIGHHPYGDAWKVNIENPFDREEILAEISLKDEALSVSGNTVSYTGHIIRPDSSEPIMENKVEWIISPDPLEAEVLSTVFMIADSKEKEYFTNQFKIKNSTNL